MRRQDKLFFTGRESDFLLFDEIIKYDGGQREAADGSPGASHRPVLRLLRQTVKKGSRREEEEWELLLQAVCVCVCVRLLLVFRCSLRKISPLSVTQACLFDQHVPPCAHFSGTVRRRIAPSICTALAKQDETLEDKAACVLCVHARVRKLARRTAAALKDEMQGHNRSQSG